MIFIPAPISVECIALFGALSLLTTAFKDVAIIKKEVETVQGYIYPLTIGRSSSFAPIAIIKGFVNKNITAAAIIYTCLLYTSDAADD